MLLFFDIDGTIFDDNRCLPDSVKPAMEAAHRNGHRIIINTGRTFCNMDRRLEEFPLDGWIMGCGIRIIFHGETLQSMEHSPAKSQRLRNGLLKMKVPTVWECDTAMYFERAETEHPSVSAFREFSEKQGIRRFITDDDPEFRAVKMFCFTDSAGIEQILKMAAENGTPYSAINRWTDAWELVPAGYSKGSGIDILREKLGAAREECYAFGDSRNDMTMFEHAGYSIAMGNATDDVKAACTYVTDRPENDGIEKAMKHYGLI